MNEEPEKQQDTDKHLLGKLPIGDVISCPLCGGETTFLESAAFYFAFGELKNIYYICNMKYDQWKIDAPDNSSPDWVRAIEEGVSNIVGMIRDIDESIDNYEDESEKISALEARIEELKDDAMGLVEELRSASIYTLADDLTYDINHSSRYV